jgi:hypothetical protein
MICLPFTLKSFLPCPLEFRSKIEMLVILECELLPGPFSPKGLPVEVSQCA